MFDKQSGGHGRNGTVAISWNSLCVSFFGNEYLEKNTEWRADSDYM